MSWYNIEENKVVTDECFKELCDGCRCFYAETSRNIPCGSDMDACPNFEKIQTLEYDKEMRKQVIDEFIGECKSEYDDDAYPNVLDYLDYKISIRDLLNIAERLKNRCF